MTASSDIVNRYNSNDPVHRRIIQCLPVVAIDFEADQERTTIDQVQTAGCQIIRLKAPRCGVDVRGKRAAENGLERYVKVCWQIGGSACLTRGGSNTFVVDGLAVATSLTDSYRYETSSDHDALLLVFDTDERPAWRSLVQLWETRPVSAGSAIAAAGAGIASLMHRGDGGRGDRITIDACLDLMARSLTEAEDELLPSYHSQRLRKARLLIEQNIDNQHYDTEALARDLGRSRRSLYEDFKLAGITPSKYIDAVRLERAKQMIVDSKRRPNKITDIALACGFSDGARFSHAFRKSFGFTPSMLRNMRK